MRRISLIYLVLLPTILLKLIGCAPYVPQTSTGQQSASPLQKRESEYVLMIVLDLSGSFSHRMVDDGKAYMFALQVSDSFFRNRVGCNDQLILAQLSGSQHSLIWQGSPIQLRQEFPSAEAFQAFLQSKADPNGSLVHEGLAHAVEYLNRDASIVSGKANSAICVLSDMADNDPNGAAAGVRLVTALQEYGSKNGVVGMWYVDDSLVAPWEEILKQSGLRDSCVLGDFVGRPTLPRF